LKNKNVDVFGAQYMYLEYGIPDVDIKQYWWKDATLSNTTFQETLWRIAIIPFLPRDTAMLARSWES